MDPRTFSAAREAPTKLGIRWWTGRGFCAKLRASIVSHSLFRITHFQAFGSSSRVSVWEASAMASRASASRVSLWASKAASSKAVTLSSVLLASSFDHLREFEDREWCFHGESVLLLLVVLLSMNGYHKRIAHDSIILRQPRVWNYGLKLSQVFPIFYNLNFNIKIQIHNSFHK